jgi:hypothetical protein
MAQSFASANIRALVSVAPCFNLDVIPGAPRGAIRESRLGFRIATGF